MAIAVVCALSVSRGQDGKQPLLLTPPPQEAEDSTQDEPERGHLTAAAANDDALGGAELHLSLGDETQAPGRGPPQLSGVAQQP